MSRLFFNTLVGMGSRSHDFDDGVKISFLVSISDAHSKTFILDLNSVFYTCGLFCTLSGKKCGTNSFNLIRKIPRENDHNSDMVNTLTNAGYLFSINFQQGSMYTCSKICLDNSK